MKKRNIRQVSFKSSVNIQGLKEWNEKKDAFLSFMPSRTFVQNFMLIKNVVKEQKIHSCLKSRTKCGKPSRYYKCKVFKWERKYSESFCKPGKQITGICKLW